MSPPLKANVRDVPYVLRPEVLVAFWKDLRVSQRKAVDAAKACNHGQILRPCGTGKSLIQAYLHADDMLHSELGVFVIASHRLALNMQLLDVVVDLIVRCGIRFDIVFCGSANDDFNRYYTKYAKLGFTANISSSLFSTNAKEIVAFVDRAKQRNRHVLIASTYHSFAQLCDIVAIQRATFDEAHNITQETFSDNVRSILPIIKNKHFFTATRKVGENHTGMDDRDLYGNVLADGQYIPSDALLDNEIACPMMHFIDAQEADHSATPNNLTMLVSNLNEAFACHERFIAAYSCSPEHIAAKLLVACSGIKEMMDIYKDSVLVSQCHCLDIDLFAISSDGCYYNGVGISRYNFMRRMRELPDNKKAIILNVDILTQGIDLPSITGVMPMRSMGKIQLLQLLGRCLRLHPQDRIRLYSSAIQPFNYLNGHPTDRIKPYGWIIIPRHLAQMDHHTEMTAMIRAIVAEYKTPVDQLVIQERYIDRQHDSLDSLIPMRRIHGAEYELVSSEEDIMCVVNINALETMKVMMSTEQRRNNYKEVGLL